MQNTVKNIILLFFVICVVFVILSILLPQSAYIGAPIFIPGLMMYLTTFVFKETAIKKLFFALVPYVLFFLFYTIKVFFFNEGVNNHLNILALKESIVSIVITTIFYLEKNTFIFINKFFRFCALLVVVYSIYLISSVLLLIGGLFIFPGLIFYYFTKDFKASLFYKTILGILPWGVFIIFIYIKTHNDPMAYISYTMISVSLLIGFIVLVSNNLVRRSI